MFSPDQYQLLDYGSGRKLERFGDQVLDRPSPAAERASPAEPEIWHAATARFDLAKGGSGQWSDVVSPSGTGEAGAWSVRHNQAQLLLQRSASGNVGIFPEQARNWDWIAEQVDVMQRMVNDRAPRVLNLFAYTGGATLAAAAAGAEVTHVDSSGPTVSWAKRNADASDMADAPVRWLVEDAMKFVARECRRGNRYDGVIADPPTYGHGPKGRPFKFRDSIWELLAACSELLESAEDRPRFLVFSCHAPGFGDADAESAITSVLGAAKGGRTTSGPLTLDAPAGRSLSAGVCARWSSLAT